MTRSIRIVHPPVAALLCIMSLFLCASCAEKPAPLPKKTAAESASVKTAGPKVTFVELGATTCMPCKMMQPVLKNLEVKYPKDLKVVFHDVWTEAGKPAAKKYGIRVIPTQVFLDAAGKEISRHEGFFPQAEIEKLLAQQGVTQ